MAASKTLETIKMLARAGKVLVSAHGYDELAADGIFSVKWSAASTRPNSSKIILPPQRDRVSWCCSAIRTTAMHVVWGIPKGAAGPAVLVTAYRPDPGRWSPDFKERWR